jgi:hypothetical protein
MYLDHPSPAYDDHIPDALEVEPEVYTEPLMAMLPEKLVGDDNLGSQFKAEPRRRIGLGCIHSECMRV